MYGNSCRDTNILNSITDQSGSGRGNGSSDPLSHKINKRDVLGNSSTLHKNSSLPGEKSVICHSFHVSFFGTVGAIRKVVKCTAAGNFIFVV